jgi:hypothetical protein
MHSCDLAKGSNDEQMTGVGENIVVRAAAGLVPPWAGLLVVVIVSSIM